MPSKMKVLTWALAGGAAVFMVLNAGVFIGLMMNHSASGATAASAAVTQAPVTQTAATAQSTQAATQSAASSGSNVTTQTINIPLNLPKPLEDVLAIPIPKSQWANYEHIAVSTSSGQTEYLNAFQNPIMVMAYWCPHCQKTLAAFQSNHVAVKPNLISVEWNEGPQMISEQQTIQSTASDFNYIGFHPSEYNVYYENSQDVANLVAPSGFPTNVFAYDGKLYEVIGEIPNAKLWGELFSSADRPHMVGQAEA